MDDLQFRRTIYAEPNSTSDEIKQAIADDPKKQEFWNEINRLDAAILQASKVDVPEGLAHKLILRQALESHNVQKKRSRIHLAIAASIAFAIGISITVWQQQSGVYLGEHALAHVYHEADGYPLRANGDISVDKVNVQLASLGAEFKHKVGRIFFAGFCTFDNVRSYHMVLEDGSGNKVTVFVVPHDEDFKLQENFSDNKMAGQMFDTTNASIIMVGEKGHSLEQVKYKLKQNMLFSA
ncbi:DUF3379 family protein [Aliiglaciecola sp. LCG003]|uniref:DUF3379 family protein n=1 Tax=Aliiglaciecola sp. LCG003 TaxID=3053655 RepID=UPI0025732DAA|nr:DUF3379 family protein [Aliiglaciecola sp. LCG003]WJG10622.1 DUF3379 family protein [Aliiglaciecola sp. LCG003]